MTTNNDYTVALAMDELNLAPSQALLDAIASKVSIKDHFFQVKGKTKLAAVEFLIDHHAAFKTYVANSVKAINADTTEGHKARENWATASKADGQAIALAVVALIKAHVQLFPMSITYKVEDVNYSLDITLADWTSNSDWHKAAKGATNDAIFASVFGYGPYRESKTQPDGYPARVIAAARNATHVALAIIELATRLDVDPLTLVAVDKAGRVKLPYGVMHKEPNETEEPDDHKFWLKNADGHVAVGPRNPITQAMRLSKPKAVSRQGQNTNAGQDDGASLLASVDALLKLIPATDGESVVAMSDPMLVKLAKLQQAIADRLALENGDEGQRKTG